MSNESFFSTSNHPPDLLISKMSISRPPQFDPLSLLTDKDAQEINEFIVQIDITDNSLVIYYGKEYQEKIAEISDSLPELLQKYQPERIHESVQQITTLINEVLSYKSNLRAFKKRFKQDKKSIRNVRNELDSHLLTLDDYNDELHTIDSKLTSLYVIITKYIVAGEKRLEQIQADILPELRKKSNFSVISAEEYNTMVQCLKFFKERLDSLYASQTSTLLLKKQIQVQLNSNDNSKSIIEKIMNNTLPAFEQAFTI